jgi:hypothetical protein
MACCRAQTQFLFGFRLPGTRDIVVVKPELTVLSNRHLSFATATSKDGWAVVLNLTSIVFEYRPRGFICISFPNMVLLHHRRCPKVCRVRSPAQVAVVTFDMDSPIARCRRP